MSGLFLILLAAAATAQTDNGVLLDAVPPKPVRVPAEFEPMQAVIVDWNMIRNADFYRYITEDVRLIQLYNSADMYEQMQTELPTYGVDMNNCEFCEVSSLPYTPRDATPWFMFVEYSKPAFVFNERGTPPYGLEQGYTVYSNSLAIQGGDFMTDGQGTAVSFEFVANIYTELGGNFMERARDYWGIDTYHLISNPDTKGVTVPPHIDCLAKFLSPDTILVVRYPSSNALYERTEAAATYFNRQISCYGTPYKVLRLDARNQGDPYINSLIVNRRVFVPVEDSDADAGALATYRAAMPGYEVIGVNNYDSRDRSLWWTFWALHCDTMGIADEQMLYIHHVPLLDRPPASEGFPIRAEIAAFSGTEFVDGTPIVLWRAVADANESADSWNMAVMTPDVEAGDHRYLGYIPSQPVGTVIQYYIEARDASGRDETHPYIGQAQAHTFTVTTLGANVSAVSAKKGGTVEFYINTGADHAQQAYRLAYSVTADPNSTESPGAVLPETTVLTGFDGTLDDLGIGAARLTFPESLASEWVGRSVRFSLELDDQQSAVPDTVSIQILE
ncbi:MAG: agmatine deiminase family protein [Phycisphaerales bacterium]